jgi:hypothetical protein
MILVTGPSGTAGRLATTFRAWVDVHAAAFRSPEDPST